MRMLILGTGGMAKQHAKHFAAIEGVTVVGGVDVDPNRLEKFNATHNIPNGFASLRRGDRLGRVRCGGQRDAGLDPPRDIDCGAEGRQARVLRKAAGDRCDQGVRDGGGGRERRGSINMVNLTYRNVAQLQKAREIVTLGPDRLGAACRGELPAELAGVARPGATGAPRASGCGGCRSKHGSNGVLGDIGVHILDFASYGSGLDIDHVFARLKTFDKAPGNKIGEYDLDANDSFTMAVDFNNGALGVIHASRWATGHFNELRLRVYGDKGAVEVQHRHDGSQLLVCLGEDIETATWKDDRGARRCRPTTSASPRR